MVGNDSCKAEKVVPFPVKKKPQGKGRKAGLNKNREGSVREVNGKVYVDFMYLDERVRESSGLDWNVKNAKVVREQLDKITVAIKAGTFRYAEVFPNSKSCGHFREKEMEAYRLKATPEQVLCNDFFATWYDLVKNSGKLTGRTLLGYRRYKDLYLVPYFGEKTFADLNATALDKFIFWAKQQKFKGKEISGNTINKCFTVLQMICKSVAIEYGWGSGYDPFFGFRKLPEDDPYEDIFPFSIEEQKKLTEHLSDHWKPYFRFAFCAGLRPGEQIAIKSEDIDWSKQVLHIRRAMTLDENGKKVVGRTKNRFSRRTIKLIPAMRDALEAQKEIHDRLKIEYFFCSTTGAQVSVYNLRNRVWVPGLKNAGLPFREMKQTRHTFATIALSCGENPLWIARVMGHRNTDMIIKVYSKYIENARGAEDGGFLNALLQGEQGKEE
jgi:integrase